MGKVVNWIYGTLLILIALDAMFIGYLSQDLFLPVAVIIMGALILFTPMYGGSIGQVLRRWVFGIVVVLMGIASFFQGDILRFDLSYLTVSSLSGQAILILIGIIYFFGGTREGKRPIRSY